MTVKGTVEDLKPGPQQGMHVMLKSSDATLELALGPSSKGDQIEVTGAKSKVDGRDVAARARNQRRASRR